MKLEAFSMLDAVLQHGTMAAAASASNLTPSAVSMQMKQLETYLGQQLFDRSGLQVRPLPLAHEVAAVMRRAGAELESLRRPRSLAVEGQVRLGMIESVQPLLLPPLIQQLRRQHPALQVRPQRGKSAELTRAVKAGELDAAVVARPETGGSSRLHWHELMRYDLQLIAPPQEASLSVDDLFARHEWVRYDRATIAGRLAARYVQARVRGHHGTLELDAVRAVVAMVSAGEGISIVQLSEPGVTLVHPVRVVPLPHAPQIGFAMVSRTGDADHRPLVAVREVLTRLAQPLSAVGAARKRPSTRR